jgi:hypothetical protein
MHKITTSLSSRFRHHAVDFHRDESGQSVVFGIISVFIILFFAAMVLAVGRVATRRIQMQFAADAAAYSAAVMESNCLNNIAAINTAMAQVKGRMLGYKAELYAYAALKAIHDQVTLNEGIERIKQDLQAQINALGNPTDPSEIDELNRLQEHLEYLDSIEQTFGTADADQITGVDNIEAKLSDAVVRAETWLPASGGWMRDLSRLEHTIAILAPYLSSEAAYKAASENGAKATSIFPASRWMPRENHYISVTLRRPRSNHWIIEGRNERVEVERDDSLCSECTNCGECEKCWRISWNQGVNSAEYIICELEDRKWFWENTYTDDSACIQQVEEFNVVTWGPEGVDVIRHDHLGYMELVNENGSWPSNTMFVRRRGGTVERTTYWWNEQTEEWEMPRESNFQPLPAQPVTLDGVRVTVNRDPIVPLPGRARIRTLDPPHLDLTDGSGRTWSHIRLRDATEFTTNIDGVHCEIHGDRGVASRRGQWLWTHSTTGNWHTHFDYNEEYWWQHRLLETSPGHEWLYEYEEFGARLREERNVARMAMHSGLTGSEPNNEMISENELPSWLYAQDVGSGWLDANTGRPVPGSGIAELLETLYRWYAHDDTPAPLLNLLQHAGLQVNPADPQSVSNAASQLKNYIEDGNSIPNQSEWLPVTSYFQVRPCWDSLDTKGGTEPPDGLWDMDMDGNGQPDTCPTCNGKGYVIVDLLSLDQATTRDIQNIENKCAETCADMDINTPLQLQPLVLDEEYFKYGVTVGTWHPRESHFPPGRQSDLPERPVEYLLHDPNPGMKSILQGPQEAAVRRDENLRPPWGVFAVSGARPRLMQNDGSPVSADGLEDGCFFDNPDIRSEWVEQNVYNLYLHPHDRTPAMWDAGLVPLNRQILDEDIQEGYEFAPETGVAWLLHRIAYGSPGGLVRSRQSNLPPTYYYDWVDEEGNIRRPLSHYGHISGWVRDIYGGYDPEFSPEQIRHLLLDNMYMEGAGGRRFNYTDVEDEDVLH